GGSGLELLLIERTASMPSHASQVAFPGGKVDGRDADWAACALREAEEELGIAPACVRVLGLCDDVPTPSGFIITPVVATIAREGSFRPRRSRRRWNERSIWSWPKSRSCAPISAPKGLAAFAIPSHDLDQGRSRYQSLHRMAQPWLARGAHAGPSLFTLPQH